MVEKRPTWSTIFQEKRTLITLWNLSKCVKLFNAFARFFSPLSCAKVACIIKMKSFDKQEIF
jgi:hypothetical protein